MVVADAGLATPSQTGVQFSAAIVSGSSTSTRSSDDSSRSQLGEGVLDETERPPET
jgi:hypothetical protein